MKSALVQDRRRPPPPPPPPPSAHLDVITMAPRLLALRLAGCLPACLLLKHARTHARTAVADSTPPLSDDVVYLRRLTTSRQGASRLTAVRACATD